MSDDGYLPWNVTGHEDHFHDASCDEPGCGEIACDLIRGKRYCREHAEQAWLDAQPQSREEWERENGITPRSALYEWFAELTRAYAAQYGGRR